jgi:RNA polymerase sigma-B factor
MLAVLDRACGLNVHREPTGSDLRTEGRPDFNRRGTVALKALAALPCHHPRRAALRDEIIEMHLPLARRLARRYDAGNGQGDDLYQVAAVALINAVDAFDFARGDVFAAFAVPTIVGELKRYFRDHGWDVRPPRRLQELYLKARSAGEDLAGELGRTPTVSDVAARLGTSEKHTVAALACGVDRRVLSLDVPGASRTPRVEPTEDPQCAFAQVDMRLTVASLLARLPRRERRIVEMRFYRELTQAQIAERVGVSQVHVSRLLARALSRMRWRVCRDGVDARGG